MGRYPLLKLAFGVYLVWGAWTWWSGRAVHRDAGILAPLEPEQTQIEPAAAIRKAPWTLIPRAQYRITARVLGVEHYHFDRLAGLVPLDLALGWGPMSDSRVLAYVEVSQSNRFYFWHVPAGAPIERNMVITHSANTHVIPDGALTARQLSRLRPGHIVALAGELVDAQRDDGSWLHTSMVRTDTGAGACEVLLVHEVMIDP